MKRYVTSDGFEWYMDTSGYHVFDAGKFWAEFSTIGLCYIYKATDPNYYIGSYSVSDLRDLPLEYGEISATVMFWLEDECRNRFWSDEIKEALHSSSICHGRNMSFSRYVTAASLEWYGSRKYLVFEEKGMFVRLSMYHGQLQVTGVFHPDYTLSTSKDLSSFKYLSELPLQYGELEYLEEVIFALERGFSGRINSSLAKRLSSYL